MNGSIWYVNLSNGMVFSSNTSNINIYVPNGYYTATVSGLSGYQPIPKNMRFNVSSSSNDFPVSFVTSANLTSVYPISTFDLALNDTQPGSFQDFGPRPYYIDYTVNMAMDPVNGYIYMPEPENSSVLVYNASSRTIVRSIAVPFTTFIVIFDNFTNSIYVSGASSTVAVYNATSLQYEPSLNFPSITGTPPSIRLMNDGKSLIAMGTSGNASVYNFVTNKITENFSGVTPSYFLPNFLSVYKDFAIFLNSAGSAISEVSIGGGITNITLPSSYNATGLVEIGNTGNFIISGDNTDNNLLFNASTLTVSTTPYNISHNVLAATYNPMSGTLYVSSFENSLYGNMNLTVINVATGKVLTKLAIPGISTSLVFDPANQQLYASGYTSASLYVYNTTHYYKVTFGQNGLPTGQSWYVNITGQKSSGPISGSTFSIYLPGGDYTYTVQTPVVCCIIPLYNEIQGNDLLL